MGLAKTGVKAANKSRGGFSSLVFFDQRSKESIKLKASCFDKP